ncbi:hypothetical protein L218DRAFT_967545 [Marasmius fiardii PR-910]|nr:hypothetical protein L218DRAFT_967545 [Marasmius fiardii PR-910]
MLLHSPFTRHFETNYAPSTQEICRINDILLDPLERLQNLDQEIARLQTERDRLQTFIHNHRALLSPFRRLPSDIWRIVFVLCLPTSEFPVRSIKEAPLLLTRVCRSWREIAVETPNLWNAIHINLALQFQTADDECVVQMRARIDGVKRWLDRSGSLPLSISMSVNSGRRYGWGLTQDDELVAPQLEFLARDLTTLLLSYSLRWKTLSVTTVPRSVLETLTGDIADVPLLENLYVKGVSKNRFLDFAICILQKTSMKRAITLRADHPPSHVPTSTITKAHHDWNRLSHLHIEYPIAERPRLIIAELAELCPELTTCALSFIHAWSRVDHSVLERDVLVSREPKIWKRLQKLVVGFPFLHILGRDPDAGTTKDLEVIAAPSLTYFSMMVHDTLPWQAGQVGNAQEQNQEAPFHQFFIQSGCEDNLTHLTVDFPIKHEILIKSLARLPSLKSLQLWRRRPLESPPATPTMSSPHYNASPYLLSDGQLYRSLANTTICPYLEKADFSQCSPKNVDLLLSFAESRRSTLQEFRIDFGMQLGSEAQLLASEHVVQSLEQLKSMGMNVVWNCSPIPSPRWDSPYDGLLDDY